MVDDLDLGDIGPYPHPGRHVEVVEVALFLLLDKPVRVHRAEETI